MSRGMKKFLPFASLKEQAITLHQMEKEKQKVDKPLLSEDDKIEINSVLTEYYGQNVIIFYYASGYIKKEKGPIKKIDPLYKCLYINDLKITFTNLLKIETLD